MKLLTSQTAADGCSFVFHLPNNHVKESRLRLKLPSFSEEKKEEGNDDVFDWNSQTSDNIVDLPVLKTRPKMIVFDKDGTLGDDAASLKKWVDHMTSCFKNNLQQDMQKSESQTAECVNTLHSTLGWDSTLDRVIPSAPMAALTWDESVEMCCNLAETFGLPPTKPREWHSQLGNIMGADAPTIPDLERMIQFCRDFGLLVAVCTSDDRSPTDNSLRNWNIDGLVDYSVCGDEVSKPKPSALPLHILCEQASLQPQDCIVVGDTTGDTGMARNANAGLCIGVLSGSGAADQLMETGADIVLPHVGHIPELLRSLGMRRKLWI